MVEFLLIVYVCLGWVFAFTTYMHTEHRETWGEITSSERMFTVVLSGVFWPIFVFWAVVTE